MRHVELETHRPALMISGLLALLAAITSLVIALVTWRMSANAAAAAGLTFKTPALFMPAVGVRVLSIGLLITGLIGVMVAQPWARWAMLAYGAVGIAAALVSTWAYYGHLKLGYMNPTEKAAFMWMIAETAAGASNFAAFCLVAFGLAGLGSTSAKVRYAWSDQAALRRRAAGAASGFAMVLGLVGLGLTVTFFVIRGKGATAGGPPAAPDAGEGTYFLIWAGLTGLMAVLGIAAWLLTLLRTPAAGPLLAGAGIARVVVAIFAVIMIAAISQPGAKTKQQATGRAALTVVVGGARAADAIAVGLLLLGWGSRLKKGDLTAEPTTANYAAGAFPVQPDGMAGMPAAAGYAMPAGYPPPPPGYAPPVPPMPTAAPVQQPQPARPAARPPAARSPTGSPTPQAGQPAASARPAAAARPPAARPPTTRPPTAAGAAPASPAGAVTARPVARPPAAAPAARPPAASQQPPGQPGAAQPSNPAARPAPPRQPGPPRRPNPPAGPSAPTG